ncbi:hypothetical protein QTG54_016894 [Skeletonema marinoi]|uniref:Delta carbonic anhydrase n=1 Tax=Skeletonema marinoi TaxID=267567 RepID=A0AAD8XRR8_9STRA|nr:hypothetical protein QTG54_016894 [Skeletonema marinoi]
MCPPSQKDNTGTLKAAVGVLGLSTVALLASTIGLAVKENNAAPASPAVPAADTVAAAPSATNFVALKENSIFLDYKDNVCAGAQLAVANKLCADLEVPTPQAGGNVTKGYVGGLDVGTLKLHTDSYFQGDMCPVNVHWHLGTEPTHMVSTTRTWTNRGLAAAGEKVRGGFHCHHYDEKDEKFTKPYDWKYCTNMEVGETYEVHWPHSSVGDCGTVNHVLLTQPLYGTICGYYRGSSEHCQQRWCSRPSLHRGERRAVFLPRCGMIIDKKRKMGTDIHYYTGSTTGTSRNNEMCSQYAPITWQVDRQCHMISASSFDDMLLQRDDMKDDLYPHGSRELVMDSLVANNAADADSLAAAAAAADGAAPEEARNGNLCA